MRGRNSRSRAIWIWSTRPHRPYEGSQRLPPGSIQTSVDPGPHRPYEGSQLALQGDEDVSGDVLIAPMRGRNPSGRRL